MSVDHDCSALVHQCSWLVSTQSERVECVETTATTARECSERSLIQLVAPLFLFLMMISLRVCDDPPFLPSILVLDFSMHGPCALLLLLVPNSVTIVNFFLGSKWKPLFSIQWEEREVCDCLHRSLTVPSPVTLDRFLISSALSVQKRDGCHVHVGTKGTRLYKCGALTIHLTAIVDACGGQGRHCGFG